MIETPADDVLDRTAEIAGAEAGRPRHRLRSRAKSSADGLDEASRACSTARPRQSRQLAAARVAVLRQPELFEPHPPHRLSQRRRAAGSLHRHHISFSVPRRPDRRAHPEPPGAGANHRRRDCGLGNGRNRFIDHDRSRQTARAPSGRELRPIRRRALRHRFSDQSGARGAGLAAAGVADKNARAHLRSRRRASGRQPQFVRTRRRVALRLAAAERREAGLLRTRFYRSAHVARTG